METTRYIEVPAEALLAELRAIGEAVQAKGGKAEEKTVRREVIFEITPPNRLAFVRIYTSLAKGSSAVRGCGDDAARLVLGTTVEMDGQEKFKPLAKSRRIYRTAPKGSHEVRVRAFLDRFKQAIREAYQAALDAPTCPVCSAAPMATRDTRDGNRQFLGCVRFPECKGTRPVPPGGNP